MKAPLTAGLLILSNTFMTLAWYGHLKFAQWKWFNKLGLVSVILDWNIFFEKALGGRSKLYLIERPRKKKSYWW